MTVIASKSLKAGVPLSVARIVIGNAPGPCASVGVQENAPVEALIVAPAGAPASSEKVSVFAGTSASVAVAVNASVASSFTVLLPIAASTGATFTSLTVTVIASKSAQRGRSVVGGADRDGVDARALRLGRRPARTRPSTR